MKEKEDIHMDGPVEGIKVVEMAEWIAGPGAAGILADWGANVIKIEPHTGDALRGFTSVQGLKVGEVNVWYEVANRNKRGIALDMRREGAMAVLERLVAQADVFLTNYRPAALERLDVTYERLKKINPRLIYASVSGFGREGPDSGKAGYDYAGFWARAGFMAKLSETLPHPPFMRAAQGDNTTCMFLAGGIVAALFARERTSQGQEVTTSLYHSGVWVLNWDVQTRLTLGTEIPTQPRTMVPNPLWNAYRTKDERWLQLAMLQPQRHWPQFCKAIEHEELEQDPRFDTIEAREKNCTALVKIIDETVAQKTTAEWKEIFTRYDLVFEQGYSISDIVEDTQAWANGFFQKVDHPILGELTTVASPIRFSATPATVRTSAPLTGQHTEEVLLEIGYDWSQLQELKDKGIII